ncbi:uncharacterized protein O3C94_009989 [Discoglossus pictus]
MTGQEESILIQGFTLLGVLAFCYLILTQGWKLVKGIRVHIISRWWKTDLRQYGSWADRQAMNWLTDSTEETAEAAEETSVKVDETAEGAARETAEGAARETAEGTTETAEGDTETTEKSTNETAVKVTEIAETAKEAASADKEPLPLDQTADDLKATKVVGVFGGPLVTEEVCDMWEALRFWAAISLPPVSGWQEIGWKTDKITALLVQTAQLAWHLSLLEEDWFSRTIILRQAAFGRIPHWNPVPTHFGQKAATATALRAFRECRLETWKVVCCALHGGLGPLVNKRRERWLHQSGRTRSKLPPMLTGATDGIGKSYAEELARMGFNIVLISRTKEKLQKVADGIEKQFGCKTKVIQANFKGGSEIYQPIEDGLKGLDIGILVNNVGMAFPVPTQFLNIPNLKQWLTDIINCNIVSMVQMTRIVLPNMVKKKKGLIINISSEAGTRPYHMVTVYSSSKVFMDFFSRGLHAEYKSQGITVQCVMPLMVSTNMTSGIEPNIFTKNPDSFVREALNTVGYTNRTSGCLSHSLQSYVLNLFLCDAILSSSVLATIARVVFRVIIRRNKIEPKEK